MSVYAVASSVKRASRGYLTAGKKYQVLCDDGDLFNIIDDDGEMLNCRWDDCAHLDGGVWRKIESIEKPESADSLRDDAPALLKALEKAVAHIERNTCLHEETYRGGAIWEICHQCGAKWADDEGGKPEFKWSEHVEQARALISKHRGGV